MDIYPCININYNGGADVYNRNMQLREFEIDAMIDALVQYKCEYVKG